MGDAISKEDAIKIVREVIGKNQGCSEMLLYDKYKESGGTYQISGRNNARTYNIEELLRNMEELNMVLVVTDEKNIRHYYISDFVTKEVKISLPSIPSKCVKCRFVKETKYCKYAAVKTEYCCLLDLFLEITDDNYYGKKENFMCPLKR